MENSTQQEAFQLTSDIQAVMETIGKDVVGKPDELIELLQKVQRELGYLPESTLLEISRLTGQSAANIFGVATFYSQFRFQPVGKHIIKVCRGTACHVKGSGRILDHLMEYLKIAPGETTKDGLFTLETVACFGSCALAPVVVVDDTVYGSMDRSKTIKLIDDIRTQQFELKIEKSAT
ncbi:NADH-quinone oxidoreductase subunit NuoE [Thermodesulfobacteriota bacterium]